MTSRVNRPQSPTHDPVTHAVRTNTVRRRVIQVSDGAARARTDVLATEEPLEIRLHPPDGGAHVQVSVTMRTPGHDFELAAGFLFTEGVVRASEDVKTISYCTDARLDGDQQYNIVSVFLRPGATFDADRVTRNFYTTSSCGVCGKGSIDAIHVRGVAPVRDNGFAVDGRSLRTIATRLRDAQALFAKTGGLHAAAAFDASGHLVALREDVGRHNAVDKLVGHAFLGRRLPLDRHVLMVSGRASFEIVQKAAAAGIPVVAAVSAPSSLACDVAAAFGITLVGFVRDGRFSVYTNTQRIRLPEDPHTPAV
ncbi:MAG TPA: formate dehydrogenase accessory sulfurtransferase FdhD [bacterium]|nr:formate dehydrogenase accessory sulfurtransferase FdhD [bacterium]